MVLSDIYDFEQKAFKVKADIIDISGQHDLTSQFEYYLELPWKSAVIN